MKEESDGDPQGCDGTRWEWDARYVVHIRLVTVIIWGVILLGRGCTVRLLTLRIREGRALGWLVGC